MALLEDLGGSEFWKIGATTRYRSARRGIKEHHRSVRCAGFDAVNGIPTSFERGVSTDRSLLFSPSH